MIWWIWKRAIHHSKVLILCVLIKETKIPRCWSWNANGKRKRTYWHHRLYDTMPCTNVCWGSNGTYMISGYPHFLPLARSMKFSYVCTLIGSRNSLSYILVTHKVSYTSGIYSGKLLEMISFEPPPIYCWLWSWTSM